MQNNALDAAAFFLAGGLTMVAHAAAMREGFSNSEPLHASLLGDRGSTNACALATMEQVQLTQRGPELTGIRDFQPN